MVEMVSVIYRDQFERTGRWKESENAELYDSPWVDRFVGNWKFGPADADHFRGGIRDG